jgi:hypothetical protein
MLFEPHGEALCRRFDAALASAVPDAVTKIRGWLEDVEARSPERARAALVGIEAAVAGGWTVSEVRGECVFVLSRGEERTALAALGVPATGLGDPQEVARLIDRLELAFGPRAFGVVLRQPLVAGADCTELLQAVRVWLVAYDRGQWTGRDAIYEDDHVAVELILLGDQEDVSGNHFLIPPVVTGAVLADAVDQLVQTTLEAEDVVPDMPITAVIAGPSMPRVQLERVFYGLPDQIDVDSHGVYSAQFTPRELSLFADPACRDLAEVWWIGEVDRGRIWENPWSDRIANLTQSLVRFRTDDRALGGAAGRMRQTTVSLSWRRPLRRG